MTPAPPPPFTALLAQCQNSLSGRLNHPLGAAASIEENLIAPLHCIISYLNML